MSSNSREVQLAQKERTEQDLSARIAALSEQGLPEDKIKKDRIVRKLRADILSLKRRLMAIDGLEERKRKQAEQKAANAAQPKVKKKGKKKAEAEPEKKKAKKEKKKQPPPQQ